MRLQFILPRVLIGAGVALAASKLLSILRDPAFGGPGYDFATYLDAAARWLTGGPFYLPEQLAGPYVTVGGDIMYPPPVLILLTPFTVLPDLLWWLPVLIVAWRVLALRPSAWGWVGIAACLAWPITVVMIYTGNPVMWASAALALATRWPWTSVFVFLKPSVFPFGFYGIRHRSWWLTIAVCLLLAVPFGSMWLDWIGVISNARGEFSGLLYSLRDVPLMLIPLIARYSSPDAARLADIGGTARTRRVGPAASGPNDVV